MSNEPIKPARLRDVNIPKQSGDNLIEKGARGVVSDNLDRKNPPIKMAPKENPPPPPAPPQENKETGA